MRTDEGEVRSNKKWIYGEGDGGRSKGVPLLSGDLLTARVTKRNRAVIKFPSICPYK
jgi:hypothetical protein